MKNDKDKLEKFKVEKFKKEFCKLLAKYPDVIVANNVRGDLIAYEGFDTAVLPSTHHDSLAFNA